MSSNKFLVNADGIITSSVSKLKVTAVKFINKYLYVGIGGNLNVYNIDCDYKYISLLKSNVLNFNNIYGIFPDRLEEKIVVHGGKILRVLPSYPAKWPDEPPWKAKDWIWLAVWLSDGTIAVVLGHNELLIIRWKDKATLKLISCEEKCILYSGLVVGDDFYRNLIVLSGTVYKEVLIWAPALNEDLNNKTIIHRLKGHNGVLFSVNYDVKSKTICSTSDDRTIRVWKVKLPSTLQNNGNAIDDHILSLNEWKTAVIQPLYCVFGHSARVFRSCMISDNRIITIGEDSYLCVWNAKGENILKQETHQSGTVCCLDYFENLKVAVTGGADGGISLWPIPDNFNDDNSSLVLPPVVPSRIKLLNSNRVIITGRNSSSLYIYDNHNWLNFFNDVRVLNYCLLEVSACRSFVSLATIQGYVIIFKEMGDGSLLKVVDEKILDAKIFSLHWLTDSLLLCCGNEGLLSVFQLTTEKDSINLHLKCKFVLPISKERWLTSAVLYDHKRDNIGIKHHNETLICGERCGSIHVYSMQQKSSEPLQTIHKIHGRLGVTCIYSYNGYIWSTGRDGCLRRFTLDKSNDCDHFLLTFVSVDKLALPWGAKIIHTDYLGILVLGFHEVDLVIWSVKSRVALRRLECGGGHREWDCLVNYDSNEISFYYLKDKNVNFISKKLKFLACPPVLDGFHLQSINALSLLSYIKTDSYPDGSILVSGGEDTTVRVSFVSDGVWKPILLMAGHLSSIRTIATLNIGSSVNDFSRFLVFTAGGRAQLKIWSIDFSNANPFDIKGAECCTHMLKDSEKIKRPWREALPTIDPETRYMDLSIKNNKEGDNKTSLSIFAVCSDGYLRVFGYGILTKKLVIMYSFEYGRCLLKTLTVSYQEISVKNHVSNINEKFNKIITAITTSTDGKLAFWNFTKELPVFVVKVHQSGINSCDIFILDCFENSNGCKFLIASGGDDCSVTVNLFFVENEVESFCDDNHVNTGSKLRTLSTWSSDALHFSQVTGIKIIENLIVTVGIDQRINLLFWSVDSASKLIINYMTQYVSVIADIHGIEIWLINENSIAVCVFGVGIEIIHIDLNKLPDSPSGMDLFST